MQYTILYNVNMQYTVYHNIFSHTVLLSFIQEEKKRYIFLITVYGFKGHIKGMVHIFLKTSQ